jgi:all-trans-retinol 13,14-reductase
MGNGYDAIVVGTGIGGLTCAAALARKGKKVLMLERGARPGGSMQPFNPDGGSDPCKSWNLGLQWICGYDCAEERSMANDYDNLYYLSRSGETDSLGAVIPPPALTKLDTKFHFAFFESETQGIRFRCTMSSEATELQKELIEEFPQEEEAIKTYFGYLTKIKENVLYVGAAKVLPRWMARVAYPFMIFIGFPWLSIRYFPLTRRSIKSVVDDLFDDERLKMIIYSHWHFLGLPLEDTPFLFFGIAQNLQQRGIFYPTGGADGIIQPLLKTVLEAGGKLLCNHRVDKFEVAGGKATAVNGTDLASGSAFSYSAPAIVSSMGVGETLARIDEAHRPWTTVRASEKHVKDPTVLILRVLFDKKILDDFEALGIPLKNAKATYRFISGETSHMYDDPTVPGWKPRDITINVPSLYDAATAGLGCSDVRAEIVTESRWEYFDELQGAYDAGEHKTPGTMAYITWQRISKGLIDRLVDYGKVYTAGYLDPATYPEGLDIRPYVKAAWLTTPLDVKAMTGHERGAIYGLDITKAKDMDLQPRSGIDGLYFTGEDIFCQGITFINGLFTASVVLGDWFMATKIPVKMCSP